MNRGNGYPPQLQPGVPSNDGPRPSVPHSASSNMNRAQRFEDEKHRIQESCFSKLDDNGQQAESYITHLRIEENAAYPSTPPPPDSPAEHKKNRVIVVAVRSTGRVRMHKARENNNGSFSIGKTWNLEDLSAVESFAHPEPGADAQRHQFAQWAGSVGFVVTVIKPYYWQAGTSKERDFFIASLVKIYRKYTKGRAPELRGFNAKEKDAMLGPVIGQQQQQPPQRSPVDFRGTPPTPQPPFASDSRPESRGSPGPRSRTLVRDQFTPSSTASASPQPPPGGRRYVSQESSVQQRDPSGQYGHPGNSPEEPLRQPPPITGQGLRQVASRERMRQPIQEQQQQQQQRAQSRDGRAGQMQYPPSRGLVPNQTRLTPQSSHSDMTAGRSESPDPSVSSKTNGPPPLGPSTLVPPQSPRRDLSNVSLNSTLSVNSNGSQASDAAANGVALFQATRDRWKPVGVQSQAPMAQVEAPTPPNHVASVARNQAPQLQNGRGYARETQDLPERKRPPMNINDGAAESNRANGSDNNDLRPPPLSTHKNASAGSRPRSPVDERAVSPVERMPGAFYETPTTSRSNVSTPQPEQQMEESGLKPTSEPYAPVTLTDKAMSPMIGGSQVATTPEPEREVQRDVRSEPESEPEEAHRPGLGPMIKKRNKGEIANTFRKAATAYNAFKPRAGGAAQKAQQESRDMHEPDGISGVVPAPLRTLSSDNVRPESPITPIAQTLALDAERTVTPSVEVSSPVKSPAPGPLAADSREIIDEPMSIDDRTEEESQTNVQPVQMPKLKRRSRKQERYLTSLGIDPSLMDGKGLAFESILSDFAWGTDSRLANSLDNLEADLSRELGRVEAGSWLGHLEQKDDRVEAVDKMLDRAIAECDELEGLLTLYSVELGTLNDDIAFIEAQSQGLQVQTANQKILHTELRNLVDTISISRQQLEPLRHAPLEDLDSIESSLLLLYNAMMTIDPTLRSSNSLSASARKSSRMTDKAELSNMIALQQKRQAYLDESVRFSKRLVGGLGVTFGTTMNQAIPSLMRSSSGKQTTSWQLSTSACHTARYNLWQYSPLILFTKEVNQPAWKNLLDIYTTTCRPLYSTVFKTALDGHRKTIRAPSADEGDFLFTSVEKETSDGLSSTTRKLTMKRSQTIAKTFRSASGDKNSPIQTGRQMPCEAFADMLSQWTVVLTVEQNFVVELFHAKSLQSVDFADAVSARSPESRTAPPELTYLMQSRMMEPDRAVAEYVQHAMQTMFEFWPTEMQTLVEQSVANDPLQGLGILAVIAAYAGNIQETSQEYLARSLGEVSARLQNLFSKFVDDQIRAIEETKVKIKKRKGVIAFMRIFPHFAMSVENIFAGATRSSGNTSAVMDVRQMVDGAYERINQAMWVSLKQIAKEGPSLGQVNAQAGGDVEDKEILNYHILLIENMNHYIEEVEDGGQENVLAHWKGKALMERAEHMDEYIKRVVRRPLGKVMDFVESTEALLKHHPGPSVASKPSHSRSTAKKVLAANDSKEIRRGIETLRKRIEKHFGEADDETLSQKLVGFVCAECEREYNRVLSRLQHICQEVYSQEEKPLEIEWTKEDNAAAFRR